MKFGTLPVVAIAMCGASIAARAEVRSSITNAEVTGYSRISRWRRLVSSEGTSGIDRGSRAAVRRCGSARAQSSTSHGRIAVLAQRHLLDAGGKS